MDQGRRPDLGTGLGTVLAGGVRRYRALLRARRASNCSAKRPSVSSPRTSATSRTTAPRGSRNGCEASWRRPITSSSKRRRPAPSVGLTASSDPLEELGDRIASARLLADRPDAGRPRRATPGSSRPAGRPRWRRTSSVEQRKRVENILSFALRIQAAGVNRRLKHDMADQVPTLNEDDLKSLSLFEPEVSDAAFHAFEQYVEAKWPLRVYAIEPVIAQQNVADVFGRRSQSAFDLVGSGLVGPVKALAGFGVRTPRRPRMRRPSA